MKKIFQIFAILIALTCGSASHALTLTTANAVAYGTNTGVPAILTEIAAMGFTLSGEIYKSDVGIGESGTFNSSYNTEYFNSATDPEDATITYVAGQPFIDTTKTTYLLVKDGNTDPAWYLFNLTSPTWDGQATIELNDFWAGTGQAGRGAISHISIYGSTIPGGGEPRVPDGGTTLALLGLGLTGLGIARSRFFRK